MEESIQRGSEQYAKRQLRWFQQDPRITWITSFKEASAATDIFLKNP
jgi:tRNA A37 N6-isopentenylltransferase MiaA